MSEPRFKRHAPITEGTYLFCSEKWLDDGPVRLWCVQQFGPPRYPGSSTRHRWRMYASGMLVEITEPDDALAFRMRWC